MTNRLHQHMALMVSSEAGMGLILDQIRDVVSDHEELSTFVDDCIELAKTRRQAVESRLQEVAEHAVVVSPIPRMTRQSPHVARQSYEH